MSLVLLGVQVRLLVISTSFRGVRVGIQGFDLGRVLDPVLLGLGLALLALLMADSCVSQISDGFEGLESLLR